MSQGLGIACHSSIELSSIEVLFRNFYTGKEVRIIPSDSALQFQKDNDWHIRMSLCKKDLKAIANEDFIDLENATDYLKSKVEFYNIYDLTYRNFKEMKSFLKELLLNYRNLLSDIWIDNDYGLVINGETFLSKLENDQNWDWRSNDLSLD